MGVFYPFLLAFALSPPHSRGSAFLASESKRKSGPRTLIPDDAMGGIGRVAV
jgi:hypothetical protein